MALQLHRALSSWDTGPHPKGSPIFSRERLSGLAGACAFVTQVPLQFARGLAVEEAGLRVAHIRSGLSLQPSTFSHSLSNLKRQIHMSACQWLRSVLRRHIFPLSILRDRCPSSSGDLTSGQETEIAVPRDPRCSGNVLGKLDLQTRGVCPLPSSGPLSSALS